MEKENLKMQKRSKNDGSQTQAELIEMYQTEKDIYQKQHQMTRSEAEIHFNEVLSDRFFNELRHAIDTKNEMDYKTLLNIIPLKNLRLAQTNKQLLILLKWLEEADFKEGLKLTLTYWSGMETGFDEYEGEIYPIISSLFLDQTFPFYSLFYIMDTLRNVVSVEEIAIELFEKGFGDNLRIALKNLFDMLGKPSGETFRILTDEAFHSGNDVAIQFMSGLQSYYKEPVRKPDYILEDEEGNLFDETTLLELVQEYAEEIFETNEYNNLDQIVEFLTKGLENLSELEIDLVKTREVLYNKLSQMTEDERKVYLTYMNQETMDEFDKNEQIFNILGPANPIINGVFKKTDHICYRYGGCRMLYCNCFEYEQMDLGKDELENEFPNVPQWFTGECEKCHRDIQKRCYAIRRPLPQGGWRGTYCSWNCLHLSGNVDDILSKELCKTMEDKINQIKIINREEMNVEDVLKDQQTLLLEEEVNVDYREQM